MFDGGTTVLEAGLVTLLRSSGGNQSTVLELSRLASFSSLIYVDVYSSLKKIATTLCGLSLGCY